MDITPPAVDSDNYFAVIPEWVLFSAISANAVRLYCVFRRHADKGSGKCFPNRKTLAKEMGVKSEKTVDLAIDELQSIGALLVTRRKNGKEWTSNLYTILSVNPKGVGQGITPRGVLEHQQTIVIEPEKEKDSPRDRFSQALEDFDTFWKAYPRKIEKKSAQIALAKALKSASLESVLKGIENLNSQIKRDQTTEKFIPYPASWLNGERWNDESISTQPEAIIPTKIPPRLTSDEFSNPEAVPMPDYVKKSLKKAYRDSDEIEFP